MNNNNAKLIFNNLNEHTKNHIDVSNIILTYSDIPICKEFVKNNKVKLTIHCQKCKKLINGYNKCICKKYMCFCNKKVICNKCKKLVCYNCKANHYCCYILKDQMFCTYCSSFFSYHGWCCLFEDCSEKLCKKCCEKYDLCRGHLLLKIHHPYLKYFEGII